MKEWPKDISDAVWDLIFKRDEELRELLELHDELDLEFWRQADNSHSQLIFNIYLHDRDEDNV